MNLVDYFEETIYDFVEEELQRLEELWMTEYGELLLAAEEDTETIAEKILEDIVMDYKEMKKCIAEVLNKKDKSELIKFIMSDDFTEVIAGQDFRNATQKYFKEKIKPQIEKLKYLTFYHLVLRGLMNMGNKVPVVNVRTELYNRIIQELVERKPTTFRELSDIVEKFVPTNEGQRLIEP
jgi:6-pyruvoyl-tetrahydropterin synthase